MTTKQLQVLNLSCCRSEDRILNAERALTELYEMKRDGLKVKRAIRKQEKFVEHLKRKNNDNF